MGETIRKALDLYKEKEATKAAIPAARLLTDNADTRRLGAAQLRFFEYILDNDLADLDFPALAGEGS